MHLERLIGQVESTAERRVNAQFSKDKRNRTSASSLTKLAKNLRKLSPDNEHARAYEAAIERLVKLVPMALLTEPGSLLQRLRVRADGTDTGEFTSRYISHYGFDYPMDGDPETFLEGLTEHYQGEIGEAEKEVAAFERELAYNKTCVVAEEKHRKAADEAAKEIAKQAAREAAEQAYKKAYDETYKEAYDEAYKEALIKALGIVVADIIPLFPDADPVMAFTG